MKLSNITILSMQIIFTIIIQTQVSHLKFANVDFKKPDLCRVRSLCLTFRLFEGLERIGVLFPPCWAACFLASYIFTCAVGEHVSELTN